MPRLNCRGNFVEAMKEMSMLENPVEGLGLTAEATSLRLKEVHITEILLVIGLGLTAEATSLRLQGGVAAPMGGPRLGLTAEATSLRLAAMTPLGPVIPRASA